MTAAALALAGCAGAPQETATMMRGADFGPGSPIEVAPASPDRQVEIIALTAQTVALYGGASGAAAGQDWTYRLGVGDVLQIFAVDAPELTLDAGYQVAADGAIQVPFLGRVPVAERSADEVREDLTVRLRQYLSAPQVDVRITGFNARHVAVVGEVARPSRQPLTDRPLTVIDAINAAGGFGGDPARAGVVLIRDGVESAVDVQGFLTRGAPTPVLRDGDVVRVGGRLLTRAVQAEEAAAHVHVNGGRSQAIPLDRGPVSVAQIAAGLALRPGSDLFVLRDGADRLRAFRLAAADAVNPVLGGQVFLRPGDMVTVDPMPSIDPILQVAHLTPALRAMTHR
ncbi:MAG: polysaccharide biosynthesis/export family protein [Rhodobacter sp.]|nr:polysaccharide biosynthesis/export family protein [Paracoccaceae bacterium]MCC0076471.1 polysaccharide biosynthesis/export family protein [Rhodobacter sp.]